MSRLRWTLVALLVVSTALFAVGVIAERSGADTHLESGAVHAESEGEGRVEAGETPGEDERVLGVELESTPLVVLAVLAGLALAALAASRIGRRRGFLVAVAVIGMAWAALDIREVLHQLDESRTSVALVAMAVAVLHLAVAVVSGRLARQASEAS